MGTILEVLGMIIVVGTEIILASFAIYILCSVFIGIVDKIREVKDVNDDKDNT